MQRQSAANMRASCARMAVVAACALLGACAGGSGDIGEATQPRDIRIDGERIFPESVTSDAAGRIYVGSLGGTIYRAAAGSIVAEPWVVPSESNGLRSLFGVLADERHGLLWTCSNPNSFGPPDPSAGSALVAFELASGRHAGTYPFPEGPAACNDIAVADDGTVYVTDTAKGRLFRLAEGDETLDLFAADEKLVGVDGIAFADDGAMYINNVRANTVERVERGADGAYAGLTTLELSMPVNGPDGLRPVGGNRFLQAEGGGGRVALVTVEGNKATVEPVRTGLNSSPGVTRVGNIGYATEGKIGYLIDPSLQDQDPGEFYIRAFTLPEGL